jgi:hypothetical protein
LGILEDGLAIDKTALYLSENTPQFLYLLEERLNIEAVAKEGYDIVVDMLSLYTKSSFQISLVNKKVSYYTFSAILLNPKGLTSTAESRRVSSSILVTR